ncbi:MAG: sel1 repeat family protein [Oscillospiraceae bacterium]|nr:sel1 repeat family protein [Oscillospiraceae bacterium]
MDFSDNCNVRRIDNRNEDEWFTEGIKYFEGNGAEQNYAKALECMENAASLGSRAAMFNCYLMYSQGIGTQINTEKAFEWCRKSAEAGDVSAMYSLGICFFNGIGCKPQPYTAMDWMEKAAENGNSEAYRITAQKYEEGIGTKADITKALYWYEEAARAGYDDAMLKCADIYSTTGNIEAASAWAEKALVAGNDEALYRYGRMKMTMAKNAADIQEILNNYFIPSAHKGHKDALYLCAEAYRVGAGTEKDEAMALKLYEEAGEKGSRSAIDFLVKLYTEGGIAPQDKAKADYWKRKEELYR